MKSVNQWYVQFSYILQSAREIVLSPYYVLLFNISFRNLPEISEKNVK